MKFSQNVHIAFGAGSVPALLRRAPGTTIPRRHRRVWGTMLLRRQSSPPRLGDDGPPPRLGDDGHPPRLGDDAPPPSPTRLGDDAPPPSPTRLGDNAPPPSPHPECSSSIIFITLMPLAMIDGFQQNPSSKFVCKLQHYDLYLTDHCQINCWLRLTEVK